MTKFVKYATSIESLELVVNEATGDIYASQRATGRMCNVPDSTIIRFIGAARFDVLKAEVLTPGGLQGAALLSEDQIFECLAKYNPSLLTQCAKAGLRVYLYGLAGYEIRPQTKPAFDIPETLEDALILAATEIKERKRLQSQIEADAGATALGKIIEESQSQNIRIGDFAKLLGDVGQNQYFDELRQDKIIMSGSRLPYQRFITAGYLRVSKVPGKGAASNKWFDVSLVTPKGQAYLAKRHKKFISKQSAIRTIEAQVSALV